MSWFQYSDQSVRRYRKGIFLRVRSLPDDLLTKITNVTKEPIAYISVHELRPKNQVLLEIWCYQNKHWSLSKIAANAEVEKYTVFHLLVDENPNWVCEGDQGRGFVKK